MIDPHQQALEQLSKVVELLRPVYVERNQAAEFEKAIQSITDLNHVHQAELEIQMDSGETKKFLAFRAQHNNARGPYKGGIRFHPSVTKEEVSALATWMTWKTAMLDLPLGGAKGGVVVDPAELSLGELERLSRAYARAFADHLGAWKDIPAPDVQTNGQIMAWMIDEFEQIVGHREPGAFTGKPIELQGSFGREEATGFGGAVVLEELARLKKLDPADTTVAVQGIGNVGYWVAKHATRLGFRVIAISDSRGGVRLDSSDGSLDIDALLDHKKKTRSVAGFPGTTAITNEELLELEVDVLIPAALEQVIHAQNAEKIQAKIILEMANGPTTPEADQILHDRKVVVVPDILANAGGVTVSSFEWSQNLYGFRWTHQEVLERLAPLLRGALREVDSTSTVSKISYRQAAMTYAVRKVVDATILRGFTR